MKLHISILLTILSVATCWGQETVPENLVAPGEKPFSIEHEAQIGIGDIYLTNSLYRGNSIFRKNTYTPSVTPLLTPDTYNGAEITTGAISASYLCRVKRWMWFGLAVSYSGFYSNSYDRINDQLVTKNKDHYVSILPVVRFSYLNRKYVNLYSAAAIGAGIEVNEKHTFNANGKRIIERPLTAHFAFQATFIGFSVGHRFYGFAELGAGTRGYFYTGFGFRFNNVE